MYSLFLSSRFLHCRVSPYTISGLRVGTSFLGYLVLWRSLYLVCPGVVCSLACPVRMPHSFQTWYLFLVMWGSFCAMDVQGGRSAGRIWFNADVSSMAWCSGSGIINYYCIVYRYYNMSLLWYRSYCCQGRVRACSDWLALVCLVRICWMSRLCWLSVFLFTLRSHCIVGGLSLHLEAVFWYVPFGRFVCLRVIGCGLPR